MAEHIYTGPVSKQLRGNKDAARELEREARAKVGYLFDSMVPGQTFKSGIWNLGNGYKIKAFVWDDVNGKRVVTRLTAPSKGGGESLFWMHHGFYGHDEATDTWRVYVPRDIEEFFLGTETEEPRGFTGVLEYDGSAYKAGSVPFPELDAEKSYDPEEKLLAMGMPVPNYREAWKASGLGVAFWQAKNGAGKHGSPPGTFPDWTLYTNRVTLVRSPQDTFWLIKWDKSTGMLAAPMTVPEELVPLYGMVRNMENEVEKRIAFSFILGYLRWSGTDPVEIMTPETAVTISEKNSLDPFQWGWQWGWQKFNAPDEFEAKALLTVYRQLDCCPASGPPFCLRYTDAVTISRECLVTLTWNSDGTPDEADLNITESGPWKLYGSSPREPYYPLIKVFHTVSGYTRGWGWGAELGDWELRYDPCPGNENSSSAVLCAWFKKDGSIFRITSAPISFANGSLAGGCVYFNRAYGGIFFGDDDYRDLIASVQGQNPDTYETAYDTGYSGSLVFGVSPRTVHFFANTCDYFAAYEYHITADVEFWIDDFHSEVIPVVYDTFEDLPGYDGEPYLTQCFFGLPGESRVGFTASIANHSTNENFISHLVPESFIWGTVIYTAYGSCDRAVSTYYWKEAATLVYSEGVTPASGLAPSIYQSWPGTWVGGA